MPKEISLKPWQECVAIYGGLRISRSEIAIVLSLANGQTVEMLFPRKSLEEENILRKLHDGMIGQKIGILKVGYRENLVLIRKFL